MADVCAICEGSGFRVVERAVKHRDGMQMERLAVPCDCRVAKRDARSLAAARIPQRYLHCTLDDYVPNYKGNNPSLNNALIQARHFVNTYPLETSGKGLLMTGPNGTGKTHLAIGIARALMAKGAQCLFVTYGELLAQVKNSYNPTVQQTELEVLRPVFDAEVLVIDELGSSKPTDWVWDTVAHILNTRYNDMRITIITTNSANERELVDGDVKGDSEDARKSWLAMYKETLGDRIGERMRSRLQEMCIVVEMTGPDFRKSGPGRASFSKRKYTAAELFALGATEEGRIVTGSEGPILKDPAPAPVGSSEGKRLKTITPRVPERESSGSEKIASSATNEMVWTQEDIDREVRKKTELKKYRDSMRAAGIDD